MPFDHALIQPRDLILGWQGEAMPFAIIDLDQADDEAAEFILPTFPLIGIGHREHRLAGQVDVLVEPPVTLAALAETIAAHPLAAAIAVQTIRHIEQLPIDTALHYESLAYGLLQGSSEHKDWRGGAARKPGGGPSVGKVHLSREDDVLDILLDRPEASNAIDRAMRDALREAFTLAALDEDIREIRLRGIGKTFSLGADLGEFGTTCDPATAHAIRMETLPAHAIARCGDRLNVHVQGGCVGSGLEMAAFARHITASPTAWFQLPEIGMGIIPGAGGCVSVTRRIGRQRAALMILSGKRIGAKIALDWGLIDAIMDD